MTNPHAATSAQPETETLRPKNTALGSEILAEKPFLTMLCLERKRTERSHRRFVLMLLESEYLLQPGNNQETLERVFCAISNSTRETDIKGWYEDGSIIGVIFTEIGTAEGKAVATALLKKITNALASTLSIDQINEIRLSFHVYPEHSDEHGTGGPSNTKLYRDLVPKIDPKRASRLLKRSMDILGSLSALILGSPLFIAIALLIKLTSKGAVFFRQERIGQYGKRFMFLKFRSMYSKSDHGIHQEYVKRLIAGTVGAETSAASPTNVFKLTNDPRITPLGRLLRRTSMDELPQFLNVLNGEMSLVGPRPPLPYEFECYDTWHKRRLVAVKPGITGLWQVGGRSRVTFDEMVRLDLKYAASWSLWLDVKILLQTPMAVVSGDGAY